MQIVKALVWEYFARGWAHILTAALAALTLVGLVYAITYHSANGNISFDGNTGDALFHGFFLATLIISGAAVINVANKPSLRFCVPTESWRIVATVMACVAAAAFSIYGFVAVALNAMYDAGWPIWGPGLLATVIITWFFVSLWSTANSQVLQLIAGGLSCAGLITAAILTADYWEQDRMLAEIDWRHLLGFAAAAAVSFVVGLIGFVEMRHGVEVEPRRLVDWATSFVPTPTHATPFDSAGRALYWSEWRRRGYLLPAIALMLAIPTLVALPIVPAEYVRIVITVPFVLLYPATLLIGIWLGGRSATGEMRAFDASRPVSDRQLAAAVLESTVVTIVLTTFVYLSLAGAIYGILYNRGISPHLHEVFGPADGPELALQLIAFVVGPWTVIGVVTSVTLAGKRVLAVTMLSFFGSLILGIAAPHLLSPWFLSPRTASRFVNDVYFPLWCFTFSVIAAWVFLTSWRMNLISTRTLLFPMAIIGAGVAAFWADQKINLDNILGLTAVTMAVALPFAAAPLAAWWNRHR